MKRPASVAGRVALGSLGFAVVSCAAFGPWAFAGRWFYRSVGEAGLYAVCAVLFLALSGLLLHPLLEGERRLTRFYRVFLPAFLAYAVVWCVAWFALRGRAGEWLGSLAGTLAFAWLTVRGLGRGDLFWKAAAVLFIAHSAGYFSGGLAMESLMRANLTGGARAGVAALAKLAWGLLYGLGYGAGIGWVFASAGSPAHAATRASRGE